MPDRLPRAPPWTTKIDREAPRHLADAEAGENLGTLNQVYSDVVAFVI